MKLLVVSHSCATSANRRLYRELQAVTGWDVTLAIPAHWRDEFDNKLDQPDDGNFHGRIIRIPVFFNGSIILHFYRWPWHSFLQRERFDAVYVNHEPYALATAQIGFACRNIPIAFGFYSCQNIVKQYPFPFCFWEKRLYHRSDFAFPVTEAVGDVLKAKGFLHDISLSPLPVDLDYYFPRPVEENLSLLPRSSGEVVIGYVGRLVEAKGLRTLASALGRIRDLPWRFSVIGSGTFQSAFSALLKTNGVRDRVTFHGYIPHDETPRYLSAFDMLVLPSETQSNWKEQFGRVIPEALACNTPVVGSDSGEIPTLITASKGGLVFPERNAGALADALRTMICDPQLRSRRAESGRQWVISHLSLPAVASDMADTIRHAVALHKSNHASSNS